MQITEKELESIICKNLTTQEGCEKLLERGLHINSKPNRIFRQLDLNPYGRADIITATKHSFYSESMQTICSHICLHIYELKIEPLKSDDIDQLYRYAQALKEITDDRRNHYSIECTLIGPSVNSGHYIFNHLDCGMFTFEYTIEGILFSSSNSGWHKGTGNLSLSDITPNNSIFNEAIY